MALDWPLAVSVVPSMGSTATSHSGPLPSPTLLAVEEHGRVVLLALADDDDAVHRHRGDQGAHRLDGCPVGAVLVAAADPAPAGHGRGLGDPHQLECEVAVRGFATHLERAGRLFFGHAEDPFTRLRVMARLYRGRPGWCRAGAVRDDGGVSTTPPRSSYASGTVSSMVRSLLVVGGLVALLIALVPRVNTISQPPVDVAAASVAGRQGERVGDLAARGAARRVEGHRCAQRPQHRRADDLARGLPVADRELRRPGADEGCHPGLDRGADQPGAPDRRRSTRPAGRG